MDDGFSDDEDVDDQSEGVQVTRTRVHKFADNHNYQDITEQASWSVSSSKGIYGVMNLIDNSLDTFWQSEAKQPHTINMQFNRKTRLSMILFFVDFDQDESYTPQKIEVKAGNGHNDLTTIQHITLKKPQGWINISLTNVTTGEPLRTFLLQMIIKTNLQNGQNSHLRQIRLLAPSQTNDSRKLALNQQAIPRTHNFYQPAHLLWKGSFR